MSVLKLAVFKLGICDYMHACGEGNNCALILGPMFYIAKFSHVIELLTRSWSKSFLSSQLYPHLNPTHSFT